MRKYISGLEEKKKTLIDRVQAPVLLPSQDEKSISYMCNVLATYRVTAVMHTAFSDYLDDLGIGVVIPHMTFPDAMKTLNRMEKERNASVSVHGYIDTIVRDSDLVISPSTVVRRDEKPLIMTTGTLGLIQGQEVARDAANFLLMMTSKEAGKKTVSEVGQDSARVMAMPWVSLTGERGAISCDLGNNMFERDAMIARLTQVNNKPASLRVVSMVRADPTLTTLVKKNEPFQKWYDDNRGSLPPMPILVSDIKEFKSRSVDTYAGSWLCYQKSNSYRGGEKGRGEISAGYYRFDAPRSFLRNIDLVSDIIMIMLDKAKRVIEFMDTEFVEVTRILISNSYVVISPSGKGFYKVTKIIGKDKKPVYSHVPGHYLSTREPRMRYRNIPLRMPVISGVSVIDSEPIILESDEPKGIIDFCRDVLRPEAILAYSTYPSIRAADGVCIRVHCSRVTHVPEPKLYARFSKAVHWRNWYVYIRAGFCARDEYREKFPTFLYPKKVEGTPDIFQGAVTNEINLFKPGEETSVTSFIEFIPKQLIDMTLLEEIIVKIEREVNWDGLITQSILYFLKMGLIDRVKDHIVGLAALLSSYSVSMVIKAIESILLKANEPLIDFDTLPETDPVMIKFRSRFQEFFELDDEEEVIERSVIPPDKQKIIIASETDPFAIALVDTVTKKT